MEWLVSALLVLGGVFTLLAGIGLLRMPDVYTRLSATSKAATLGASSLLLATALHFQEVGFFDRALAMVAFLFLTAPVAAHMIGRAAYLSGVELWQGTRLNELAPGTRTSGTAASDSEHGPRT